MFLFEKSFWLRVDRNANSELFEGDRKETISSRLGRRLIKGKKGFLNWRYHFCRVLSFIERTFTNRKVKHCEDSVNQKEKVEDGIME